MLKNSAEYPMITLPNNGRGRDENFVVNLHYVDKISGAMLIMRNGTQVYLAQKRTAALRKQLMMNARKAIHRGGKD